MTETATGRIVRFSVFEIDLQSRELRRRGLKVKLQSQPFQVLATLLERRGEVVTREELRLKLWPADTFVDFDHGLNVAVKRLREALGDSAETPIFVETLARRGYRFIGVVDTQTTAESSRSQSAKAADANRYRTRGWVFVVALAVLLMAAMTMGFLRRQPSPANLSEPSPTLRRLTTNPTQKRIIASAISPDGKYLAYSDKTGVYLRLLSTGELRVLLAKISDVASMAWSPDSAQLLASWPTPTGKKQLWALSLLGGAPRQISEEGWAASFSSDGSQIALLKGADFAEMGHEIWVMRPNGSDQRKLVSFPQVKLATPVWSPDGRWIAYIKHKSEYNIDETSIELFDFSQGTNATLLSRQPVEAWGMTWLPDGRLIYARDEPPPSQHSSNFWAASVDLNTGQLKETPARITAGEGYVVKPSFTSEGKRLVFTRARPQADIYIADFSAKELRLGTPRQLTFDEGDDLPFDWTSDNKAVLFVSTRTGTDGIFRQRIDETSAEMLVVDQDKKSAICRVSPDGSQILYSVPTNPSDNLAPVRLMRAPIDGGPPQLVFEAPAIGNFECSHAPATICAFDQQKSKGIVISAFDAAVGDAQEVATLPKETFGWGLSPDGKSIAFIFGASYERIGLVSLSGEPTRELTVKNWSRFNSVDWAADAKGLFVGSNPTSLRQSLLYVDLAGNAHEIWQMDTVWPGWAVPSRNGKYVAILESHINSNVWMAESF